MPDNTRQALREISVMLDNLKDICSLQSRNELSRMCVRLRHLALREMPLSYSEEIGNCDRCGSRLVYRGRNPSVLVCPLGHENEED